MSKERALETRLPVSYTLDEVGGRLKYDGTPQGVSGVMMGVEAGEECKSYDVDREEPREAGLAINLP